MLPILEAAVRELQGSDAEAKRQQVEAEQARLATELGRLTEAIAAGGGVTLVEAVKVREAQQQTLRGELAALDQMTQVGRLDQAQLERTARECLTDWQGLLAGQPVQARQMLKKFLEGRLVFTPTDDGTTVEFRGTGVLDPVLSGIVDGDGVPKASGSRWSHHHSSSCPLRFRDLRNSMTPSSGECERVISDHGRDPLRTGGVGRASALTGKPRSTHRAIPPSRGRTEVIPRRLS